jgi:hypothetical protein
VPDETLLYVALAKASEAAAGVGDETDDADLKFDVGWASNILP